VFENSPKQTRADVRHELVPEISVASQILTEPATQGKLREVSSRLKTEDAKWKGRFSLPTAYTTPRASLASSPVASEIVVDEAPAAGFKRKQELWEGRSPNGSPVQQKLRRESEHIPFLTPCLVLEDYQSVPAVMRPPTEKPSLFSKIKKFLCCEDYSI